MKQIEAPNLKSAGAQKTMVSATTTIMGNGTGFFDGLHRKKNGIDGFCHNFVSTRVGSFQ